MEEENVETYKYHYSTRKRRTNYSECVEKSQNFFFKLMYSLSCLERIFQ